MTTFDAEFKVKRSKSGFTLGYFRLYTVNPGAGPDEACESLALVAPAFASYNGNMLYAIPGDDRDVVGERLWATMSVVSRAYERGLRPHGCLSRMMTDMGATAFHVQPDAEPGQVYRDLLSAAPSVALYWGAPAYAGFGESVDAVRTRHRAAVERLTTMDPREMGYGVVVRPWRDRWVAIRIGVRDDDVVAECPDKGACEAAARLVDLYDTFGG